MGEKDSEAHVFGSSRPCYCQPIACGIRAKLDTSWLGSKRRDHKALHDHAYQDKKFSGLVSQIPGANSMDQALQNSGL